MRRLAILLLLATAARAQEITLKPIITGLDQPTSLTHAGDSRLFITLQRGQIVIWDGTRVLPSPFLDIRALVACCNERGLLGLAFDPHYAENGRFFVDYTRTNGDVVLARYNVSSSRDVADASSGMILLTVPHSQFANHNGGQLAFGPDGYLYMGVGDGGSGGDPNNNGQNLAVLLGKILRLDVRGASYSVPSSNPFVARSGARGEIWAYGLRNPWRFSFDRESGDLWIADVGQNLYEEVDLQRRTSIGGENYGWRITEGLHCFNPSSNCDPNKTVTYPIIEYSHADGSCSITGGYVYRGANIAALRGSYVYGDYCTGVVSTATASGSTTRLMSTPYDITSFGEDLSGELYLLHGGTNGSVLQFTGPPPPARRRAARKQ
jgi:glucose/arabinose dehydrogenase